MRIFRCCRENGKRTTGMEQLVVGIITGAALGFFLGVLRQALFTSNMKNVSIGTVNKRLPDQESVKSSGEISTTQNQNLANPTTIWVATNPKGAERLVPGIVASDSDFFLRRLWGNPAQDLITKPKYLVAFTVSYDQKKIIDAAVKKFSDNFTILLFHYDGRTSEWDEFEWSKKAIHVTVHQQTKWWYAKRFLHPNIVAPYEYIFIWDEDLGVEHFDAEEYIKLVRKHGLEISQPALVPNEGVWIIYNITRQINGMEVHKFIEIMAPVFSRSAWKCVWYMIQNDLVHGWGFDSNFRRCVTTPDIEKMGVVDAQPIVHQGIPSLSGAMENGNSTRNDEKMKNETSKRNEVRERGQREAQMFYIRMDHAEKAYYRSIRVNNCTT